MLLRPLARFARDGWSIAAPVAQDASRITFKEYAEEWRSVQVHRPGTAKQVESYLRRHVYPRIGGRPIGAIRRTEIQALVRSIDLAPGTVNIIYVWVSTIFKAAARDHIIPESPCTNVRLPVIEESKIVPLAPEVVVELVERIDPRYRAIVALGAGTGVRISEALAVTKDRLDPVMRSVDIDRQLVGIEDDGPVFGPVKDRLNRPRTIPLPEVVTTELNRHLAEYGPGPDDLLFSSKSWRPLWRSTFAQAWRRVADPLGVEGRFHELRHFYASTLLHHGESILVVQNRLGHSSAQITLDVYGHLIPDTEERTRVAVDTVLEPLVSATCHESAQGS